MESKKEETLNITLKNEEIKSFKSIITKIQKEDSRIGFNAKIFTEEEVKLLKDISNV